MSGTQEDAMAVDAPPSLYHLVPPPPVSRTAVAELARHGLPEFMFRDQVWAPVLARTGASPESALSRDLGRAKYLLQKRLDAVRDRANPASDSAIATRDGLASTVREALGAQTHIQAIEEEGTDENDGQDVHLLYIAGHTLFLEFLFRVQTGLLYRVKLEFPSQTMDPAGKERIEAFLLDAIVRYQRKAAVQAILLLAHIDQLGAVQQEQQQPSFALWNLQALARDLESLTTRDPNTGLGLPLIDTRGEHLGTRLVYFASPGTLKRVSNGSIREGDDGVFVVKVGLEANASSTTVPRVSFADLLGLAPAARDASVTSEPGTLLHQVAVAQPAALPAVVAILRAQAAVNHALYQFGWDTASAAAAGMPPLPAARVGISSSPLGIDVVTGIPAAGAGGAVHLRLVPGGNGAGPSHDDAEAGSGGMAWSVSMSESRAASAAAGFGSPAPSAAAGVADVGLTIRAGRAMRVAGTVDLLLRWLASVASA
ncbi:hypothetical protein H9P43_005329 [Blastocladiella emersonii ATCC 22665]|nr:hypothetical protein H9P43_005329 [Blastocladiella emersonii ATCC 22665]